MQMRIEQLEVSKQLFRVIEPLLVELGAAATERQGQDENNRQQCNRSAMPRGHVRFLKELACRTGRRWPISIGILSPYTIFAVRVTRNSDEM
jgi:hypothetical protein